MDLTDRDLALILAGLFELQITHLEHDERCAAIDALAARLGGDPAAMFFGAPPLGLLHPVRRSTDDHVRGGSAVYPRGLPDDE